MIDVTSEGASNVQTNDASGIKIDPDTKKSIDLERNQIEDLKEEISNLKKEILTILGLFVSLITFVSVEIQILKAATTAPLLIGLSCFMLGGMLLFAMTLINFVKKDNHWANLKSPFFLLPMLAVIIGITCFSVHFFCPAALNAPQPERKICVLYSRTK